MVLLRRRWIKEHFAELLRRADAECAPGLGVDLRFELGELDVEPFADRGEHAFVHLHARHLHRSEDGDERELDLLGDLQQPALAVVELLQLLRQHGHEPEGDVGILTGVRPDVLDRHVAHRQRVLARPDEVGDGLRAVVEVEARHVVELVAGLGVEEVVRDHRIEDRPAHIDAVPLHHDEVVLHVVADFEERLVFERSADRIERFLLGRAVGKRRRNVDRRLLFLRERHADELGHHRIDGGRLGVKTQMRGVADDVGGEFEFVPLPHRFVIDGVGVERGDGLVRAEVEREGGVVLGKKGGSARAAGAIARTALGVVASAGAESAPEADRVEERVELVEVGVGAAERVPVEGLAVRAEDLHVGANRDELFGEAGVVGVVGHPLAGTFALEVGGVLDDRLDVAVLLHERHGRFLPDAGHAGHVVRRVADEGQEVDELARFEAAVLLGEGLGRLAVEGLALVRRAEHVDAVREELAEVLVGREDHGVDAFVLGALRERPDHVVGLDALGFEHGDVERLNEPLDERDVRLDLVRHRRPVRFVVLVELVAERRRAAELVEDDGDVLGLVVFEELEEGDREAVERPRVGAVGGRERGVLHREEGAVRQRHRIGEEQRLALVAGCGVGLGVGRLSVEIVGQGHLDAGGRFGGGEIGEEVGLGHGGTLACGGGMG